MHAYIMEMPKAYDTAEIPDRTPAHHRDRQSASQSFQNLLQSLAHSYMLRSYGDWDHRPVEIEEEHQAGKPDRLEP